MPTSLWTSWLKAIPQLLIYAIVVGAQLALLVPLAFSRTLDGDEGFYSLAAALVADGQVPYEDFWFLQTPLLPYAYGAWTKLFGESWYNVRLLSALLTVGLGVLIYRHAATRLSSRGLGLVAVLLYATSSLVFQWYLTIKTYALSTLLLFAAYMLVARSDRAGEEGPGSVRWVWAGALLGLAIDVRLLFAAVVPVFALYAMRPSRGLRRRIAAATPLLCGLTLGLLPSAYFLARGPRRFLFDTFEYQRTRSNEAFGAAVSQKLRALGELCSDTQFVALMVAVLALVVSLRLLRRRLSFAVTIAGALGLASLLPSPVYPQYFCTLVPFLIVAALDLVVALGAAPATVRDRELRGVLRGVAVTALVLYLAVAGYQIDRMLKNNKIVFSELSDAQAVAKAVDANTQPGEVVLAFWPAYLYETDAKPLRGFENDFGTPAAVSGGLSPARAAAFRLLTLDGMEQAIRSGRARVVVWSGMGSASGLRPWPEILDAAGYQVLTTVDRATIYVLRER